MINVAMLSKWHVHAEDYANQARNNENITIRVVWDEDPIRGEEWAETLGVPFEKNLETVLADPDIDAVIVDTPTNLHKEVIVKAANYKKHIFTEKVLAFSFQDCEEILKAVKENDVKLMVSLPRLTEAYYVYAQQVIDRGLLGRLTSIRCRLAHNGAVPLQDKPSGWLPDHFFNKEQCGGGALIDLGAHPIYLTNRLAGPARAVTARLQHTLGHDVDDNAVVLVEYDNRALGVIETGFLASGSPFQLELYGTEGTLMIDDTDIRLKSKQSGDGWTVPDQMPEPLPQPMEQWVDEMINNRTPTISEEDVTGLTLINEASRISNDQGRRVEINEVIDLKQKAK